MPNKITFTITTKDGKSHQVSEDNIKKYGIDAYAKAYGGATIRMRDKDGGDYDIPLGHYSDAMGQGLHAFRLEHLPTQPKQSEQPAGGEMPNMTAPVTSPFMQDIYKDIAAGGGVEGGMSAQQAQAAATGKPAASGQQSQQQSATPQQQGQQAQGFNFPTMQDIMNQEPVWKPTPMFETETSIDKEGNRVSTAKPMPVLKDGKVVDVYTDMLTGKQYEDGAVSDKDAEDFQRGMQAANRTTAYDNVETLDGYGAQKAQSLQQISSLGAEVSEMMKQRGLELDAEALKSNLGDRPMGGGAMVHTFNSSTANGRWVDPQWRQLDAASQSLKKSRDIIEEAEHNQAKGNFGKWLESSFLGGAGRGFGNKLFDPRTWDMGLNEGADASELVSTLQKFDSGKKLTRSEQMMLDAKAVEMATDAYFGSYIGRGYKAGEVTAESIPFMLEMCINPASGAGKSAQSMLTRYALKRFGKKTLEKNAGKYLATKVGTRVAGDIAGAATMSATSGIGRVAADAQQRMAGQVQFKTDDNGKTMYAGHTKGDDAGTAFAKAFANTTIENYSEMFGEYFAPVLSPITKKVGGAVSKGLDKVGLSSVNDFISNVGASDVARLVTDFEKHSKWNGVFGEYAEEVAGNMMNAAIVGDQTFDAAEGTGVFNLDQNIDTFLGVSLMGGFMSGVKAAGYRSPKYRARKDMEHADDAALGAFGNQDTWGEIRNTIAFGNDEERHNALVDVLNSEDYTDEQKRAAMTYAKEAEKYRGMLEAERKRRSDKDSNPLQTDAETSFDNGYSLASAQEMNDAKNMLEYQQHRVSEALQVPVEEVDKFFGDDPVATLTSKMSTYTPEEKAAAIKYVNAKATWDGMIQRVKDDIESQVAKSDAEVDARTNRTSGQLQSATMKYEDRPVFVVGGNVQMMDDGTMIDNANSDESVVIRDAATGKVEMVSPSDILKVDAPVDPEEEKQRKQQEIRESVADKAANDIDGVVSVNVGDTHTILDDGGQQHEVAVVQATDENGQPVDLPQGQVAVSVDGAEPTIMPTEAIQQGVDQYNLGRLQQHEAQQVEAEAAIQEQEHEATRPVYELNDEVTLRDDDGLPVRGSITAAENEDGLIEVWTESPIGGNRVNMFTRDQLDGMLMQQNGEEVTPPVVPNAEESVPETADLGTQTNENVPETAENVPVSQELESNGEVAEGNNDANNIPENGNNAGENIPQRAIDRIPTVQGEDGKTVHQWEQAEVGDTYDALNELYGDAERTKKKVGKRIDNLDKQVKAVQKQIDKLDDSDDFDADMNNESQYQQFAQQKAELEAQKKYWQGVQRVPQDRQRAEDQRTEGEKAQARAEAEAAAEAAKEQARIDRERTNGVPDVASDKPEDARARGFRNVTGQVVERQQQTDGVVGRESNVKFSNNDTVKGRVKVIEAEQLQPSHIGGQRNVSFFIDEAQPKDRTDQVSNVSAAQIAENINPEEITGDGSAYQFSAPTVNTRGEVIQGNNRSDALRQMWGGSYAQSQAAYKQYLIAHADEFGLDANAVAAMQHPVMVNEVDVDDNEAIRLGQLTAKNIESGGIERIDPVTTSRTLGKNVSRFANILLSSSDENATLSELLEANGDAAIKYLAQVGAITPTQVVSAYDAKGRLTGEAKNDLQNILKQSLFEGGVSDLKTMFEAMPAKAQKAVLSTFMRDFDSTEENRILPYIQQAIEVWYHTSSKDDGFKKASNYEAARGRIEDYKRQTNLLDDNLPTDIYSNFAFELAARMQGSSMKAMQTFFNDFYDLVQGNGQGDLFGEKIAGEKVPMVEAIKRVFNIDFKPINNNDNGQERSDNVDNNPETSQSGRQGEPADDRGGEQTETGTESADSGTGVEGDTEQEEASNVQGEGTESIRPIQPQGQKVTTEQIDRLLKQMNATAEQAASIDLTPETWNSQFGEDGTVDTPVGKVKMGENQLAKLFLKKRTGEFGMILPTLTNPDVVIEKHAPADGAERDSKYLFAKTFVKADGSRIVHFESVTVRKANMEVSISSHEIDEKVLKKEMQNGTILHLNEKLSLDSDEYLTETPKEEGSDLVPTPDNMSQTSSEDGVSSKSSSSDGKVSKSSRKSKGKSEKTSDSQKEKKRSSASLVGKGYKDLINGAYAVIGETTDQFGSPMYEAFDGEKIILIDQSALAERVKNGAAEEQSQSFYDSFKRGADEWKKKQAAKAEDTKTEPKQTVKAEDKHKLVSTERYDELKRRLRAKLGQLNMGVDPEILAIGTEMAVYHIEGGTRKFVDYAKAMIADVGDAVRPYLKAFYNGVRDMPEAEQYADEMTPYDEVRQFNVATIGENGEEKQPTVIETAEQVSNENTVERNEKDAEVGAAEGEKPLADTDRYTITPAEYVKKNGKTLNMYLVMPKNELGKDEKKSASAKARELNGWYDRNTGGYLLRTLDAAQMLADDVFGNPIGKTSSADEVQAADASLMGETGTSRDEQEVRAALGKTFRNKNGHDKTMRVNNVENGQVSTTITYSDGSSEDYEHPIPYIADALQRWEEITDNNNNNETDRTAAEQAAANTEALASEAETVASEAEHQAEAATTEEEVNAAEEKVDEKIEEVNAQLALLGYYEAEPNAKDYNEAMGYLRNAEKKAVADALQLAKKIAKTLGLVAPKKKDVRGNIAPIGGDVSFRLPLSADRELYFTFLLDADGDNLKLRNIMFRMEDPVGGNRYLSNNNFVDTDTDFDSLMSDVKRIVKHYAPDITMPEKSDDKTQNADNKKEKGKKTSKSKKKSVTSSQETQPDLFGDLFGSANVNENDNENDTTEPRSNEAESGADRNVGDVPADGNGILEPEGTGTADGGTTAPSGAEHSGVADGEQTVLPTVGSRGGRTERDNVGSAEQSDGSGRGHGVSTGDAENGRDTTGEAHQGSRPTDSSAQGGERRVDDGSKKTSNEKKNPKNTRNYLYGKDAEDIDNLGPVGRLRANVEALETLVKVLREQRTATAEERAIMGKFRGWGGVDLSRYYSQRQLMGSSEKTWNSETRSYEVRETEYTRLGKVLNELDPDGKRGIFKDIKHAALTSYYTPLPIARAMNDYLALAGYKGGGNLLDPSMGTGVFEGTMPKAMQQSTQIYGVELDWLTAQLAKQLYPDAHVENNGFEKAELTAGAYDIVESNIPFGDFAVNDPSWKHDSSPVRKAAQQRIHNYFAVKMMEMAKAGGLVTIMTSNAIMDTQGNSIIRKELLRQGEFLGAVRLPNNVFKGAGTAAVTDVIFMRKWRNEEDMEQTTANPDYKAKVDAFTSSAAMRAANAAIDVPLNGYYAANPQMMIGDVVAGGQYRQDEFGLTSKEDAETIAKKMSDIIKKHIVGKRKGMLYDTTKPEREVYQAIRETYVGDGNYNSAGNIVEQNGKIGTLNIVGKDKSLMFEENPELKRYADRIKMYIPVRTAFKKLTAAQINREDENTIKALRKELNDAYIAFVAKFGELNDKKNAFIEADIDSYQMRGLEILDGDTGKVKGLADIFTKDTIKPQLDMNAANNPSSAIATSLAAYGEIRPAFMEKVLGENWREQCHGTLYRLPNSDSYVVADDYLSGDVKTKLAEAKAAAAMDEAYQENVEALEKVQPQDLLIGDINIRMGARWVSDKTYTDFMREMFGLGASYGRELKSGVRYVPEADEFLIEVDSRELGGEADRWATGRKSAKEIFEAAMKDKTIVVNDTDSDGKPYVNKEQTDLANDKVQELRETFETWVSSDPERGEQLAAEYNDRFNRTVIRKWNGDFLDPVGLQGMTLRAHQKAAVWMLLNNRGGIVDHIVGAGKTLVMQSAIMEMRRMGIAKKPMILALKATCGQIAKEFTQAYPSARILAPTEKDFSAKNRKKLLAKIASNDYDCILISHEHYTQLPHTQEVETQVINEQLEQLEAAIMLLRNSADKSQLTKRQLKGLEKRKANLTTRLEKMLDRKVDREFCFENLGVDYLFVDECQQFKSLPYATTYNQVAGLGDAQGSQKAIALLNGVRYLQQLHQGDRGTVFLSGTTITNSLVEVYNLMNYLRPNMMQRLGYTTFDAWAAQFAMKSSDLEYGVTNELKPKARFRTFQNVAELGKMYAEIADVRNDMNLELPKPRPNSHLVKVPASALQDEIFAEVTKMVSNKDGSYFGITAGDPRKAPWALHASRISEAAAIDPRLVFPDAEADGGKIPVVCETVAEIYKKFADDKGTQMIFCDKGVPDGKKSYDVYSDIIDRLVNEYGIPRSEIVDIHTANTDEKRKALFRKVNEGSVRILIGGTKNMGTGVNVQRLLIAEHHVDMPWTPADREQREGRAVRQGNLLAKNKNGNKVELYYYATEGSLDSYKYQLQEIKGNMFNQFKTSTLNADEREFDEKVDAEGNLDPAEMVAILSGNPIIFEKSKQDRLVKKLRRQEAAERSDFVRRQRNYEEAQRQYDSLKRLKERNDKDVQFLKDNGFVKDDKGSYPNQYEIQVGWSDRRTFDKASEAGKAIHDLLKQGKEFKLVGYGVTAEVKGDENGDLFSRQLVLTRFGEGYRSASEIRYAVNLSDSDTVAGQAFRNLLERIVKIRDTYQKALDEAKRKLQGSEQMGEYHFSKQQQLEEAVEKKKEIDAEYKKLSAEPEKPESESGENEDNNRYRIREAEPPKKTGIGYKVFVLKNGKLYPPMVANPNGADTPTGVWLDADAAPVAGTSKTGRPQVKAGGKGTQGGSGKLAYRPGWHLGVIPFAKQFARLNPETGERELFPNNFVWAEVEYAADNDYQQEAHDMGVNENGKYVHSLAGLKHLPTDGFYMYRTNVDPTTDPWVITGAMKVNRLLTPSEVDKMVRDAGREPQARQEGAVTDEQINELNKEIAERNATDAESIAKAAKKTGKKLGAKVRIVENVEELTDKDARKQKRMRRAKGWYDTATGEVVVVVPNADNVGDVVATVLHEVVGHEGLRKVVGEQHFDNFLRKVYERSSRATRAAINALAAKNGWNFSLATEEYIAEMAESGFNNRENLGTWERIKQFFKDMLSAAKIAVGIDINDNDLRYMLWRSYQMQQSRGAMGVAEDIAMQQQLGVGNYADTNRYRNGGSLPTDDVTDIVRGMRHEYDAAMKKSGFQVQEAIQDSMLSLKKLMDIVQKHSGKKEIADWENAYMAENALSSRNKSEQDEYRRKYYKPIVEAMRALDKDGLTEDDLSMYVMAKHGVERNREMAVRAAIADEKDETLRAAMEQAWIDQKRLVRGDDRTWPTWRAKQEALDEFALNDIGADLNGRDYSGLTSIYETDDVEEARNAAYDEVEELEAAHDMQPLNAALRAATGATLEKLFTSGMISAATRDSISEMYDYYVPLRGFDETTAEEVYAYVRDERNSFNNPLKRAKGRVSMADSPFAHIMSMADSAILQGNKNLMKQKFLNFVLNRPSDLVSVSDMWIKQDPATGEWVTAFPDIPVDATPEEVEQIVNQFNEDMQTESEKDDPVVKKVRGKADVPYRTLHGQLNEHQVIVRRNGREYVLTINGNPRAAMALNGDTNPNADYSGTMGWVKKRSDQIMRLMSGMYTTKNPDFVVSNFMRDMLYTNTMVWVKESPQYAKSFHKNCGKFNAVKMGQLFHKYNHGKLDMSNPVEQEFYRFMMNGGETGYSNLKEIEELKKQLSKDLQNSYPHQAKEMIDRIEIINRAIENAPRFAAYMSSREAGRSVSRSVWDAKEISVNFNKKGAGGTFVGKTGQTRLGNIAGAVSAYGRGCQVFFSAGVQGVNNFAGAVSRNPKKGGAMLMGSMFMLGAMAFLFSGGGDGDDDDYAGYYDIPSYVRRSNFIFRIPGTQAYFSWALPVEYRMIYGMGELATSVLSGKERYTGKELAVEMASQLSQALPMDPMTKGKQSVWDIIAPTPVQWYVQNEANRDWKGMPLYKKTAWNEDDPEWTKAYSKTNRGIVAATKWLNEVSGGDDAKRGWINWNPAKIENFATAMFGGYANMLVRGYNTGDMLLTDAEWDNSKALIANRMLKNGDERTRQQAIDREYFDNVDRLEELKNIEGKYKKLSQDPKKDLLDRAEYIAKLNDLYLSDAWRNMQTFETLNKSVKKQQDALKAMPIDNPLLESQIWNMKRQANEVARGE